MTTDHLDPDLRAVRAALALLAGYPLPEDLAALAEANAIPTGGWVFPPAPGILAVPELAEAHQMVPRGAELIAQAEQLGVRMLVPGDAGWPVGTAADALPCLWVYGEPDVAGLLRQAVTVTGSRACDAYGSHVAGDLAYSLASLGWTVVAAAGFGIDHEASVKARAAGGRVVLVAAGSPVPAEQMLSLREATAAVPAAGGVVLSAFPPGTTVTRARWAVQQHLLATLSAGTVVVQASRNSRALEVAKLAAAAGRAVCAVPGPVTVEVSVGCHRLLDDGIARLVSTGREVAAAITGHAALHTTSDDLVFEVSGRIAWDDGVWRIRALPPLLITAATAAHAADIGFDVAFLANPGAAGASFDASVRGPDGVYETIKITTTR